MMKNADHIRRQEFTAYFEKNIGNRQILMDAGFTKGRVSQLFDPSEPFGERAAINIENKLYLTRGTIFPSLAGIATNTPQNEQGVPVVGSAKLGDKEAYFVELDYPVGNGEGTIQWHTKDPNAYALRCVGDSMKPRIRHGEFVIIEPNHTPVNGDEVVVKDQKGRVMVKVLSYTRDDMIYFASVNDAYAPFGIDKHDIELIHYVAGIAKSALHKV